MNNFVVLLNDDSLEKTMKSYVNDRGEWKVNEVSNYVNFDIVH